MSIRESASSRHLRPDQWLKLTAENPPQATFPASDACNKKFNSRPVAPTLNNNSSSPHSSGELFFVGYQCFAPGLRHGQSGRTSQPAEIGSAARQLPQLV